MTYTFDIKKTNKNYTPSNNNASKSLDTLLLSSIKKMMGNTHITPKKNTKKTYTIDIDLTTKKHKSPRKPTTDEFINALKTLMNTDYFDTYDYKIGNTPIKFFGDEIQIGHNLYTIEEGLYELSNLTTPARKKEIIDIYINL